MWNIGDGELVESNVQGNRRAAIDARENKPLAGGSSGPQA